MEGTVWNIGFWDGRAVTWPQAPALRGTAERLLQAGLVELVRPPGMQLPPAKTAASGRRPTLQAPAVKRSVVERLIAKIKES